MKTVRFTILIQAFALLLAFGSNLRAQTVEEDIDRMRQVLGDYITLASQAQGLCQQVETFAANGNMNQFMSSRDGLIRAVSEIGLIKTEMARITLPNRIYMDEIRMLAEGIESDIRLVDAFGRADVQATGALAATLRDRLHEHRGQAQEKRIALCCVML